MDLPPSHPKLSVCLFFECRHADQHIRDVFAHGIEIGMGHLRRYVNDVSGRYRKLRPAINDSTRHVRLTEHLAPYQDGTATTLYKHDIDDVLVQLWHTIAIAPDKSERFLRSTADSEGQNRPVHRSPCFALKT